MKDPFKLFPVIAWCVNVLSATMKDPIKLFPVTAWCVNVLSATMKDPFKAEELLQPGESSSSLSEAQFYFSSAVDNISLFSGSWSSC